MILLVNGEDADVPDGTTIEELMARLGFPDKGIAVAVDWEVLPRSSWHTVLADGARVEVVTAVQGG
ncbi:MULTISPECIES: sulfur carrier protein ThiS [Mycolicibacterium]|uniref:Sulfur carrier protein ThiS n=1 Tax=Mycolicibacterium neoaurum TaxID=1795 RepID=A0AAV2WEF8_MYCNE|nr:sulfur carrier protein ThiS [Mycolicibacterium neoaurum]QVI27815.1 sulfur carrier protein ThiS [Mycolicibacterium neoaurum]TLH59283.1 thiamine biosynthesis protein ThiS [Mycolicibacterium neoaurum]CDQ42620.1 sulfur carrier protein ThiS [Mycolicibacterium neoaurum]SDD10672.1 sulfur carrier protein [Mycolicibacterium neoaurum]